MKLKDHEFIRDTLSSFVDRRKTLRKVNFG